MWKNAIQLIFYRRWKIMQNLNHTTFPSSLIILQRSCPDKILAVPYWPWCTNHVQSKFLSYVKLVTLRNISWNFELYSSSGYRGVVWIFFCHNLLAMPTDHVRSKFLSDAKLGTLWKISWNVESNPSSHYRGVVQKDLALLTVYGQNICATDRLWSKVLSGAKLSTLRNIFWKFELTSSSFDREVGPTTFWLHLTLLTV